MAGLSTIEIKPAKLAIEMLSLHLGEVVVLDFSRLPFRGFGPDLVDNLLPDWMLQIAGCC